MPSSHLGVGISVVAADHEPVSASTIAYFARRVEELGFAKLYFTDNYFRRADPAFPAFHSTSAFAVAAAATQSIRLGFCAYVAPLRHPIAVAKELAFLDGLCEGRLDAGVAAGSFDGVFQALGLDFGTRGERLDETLTVTKRLWTEDRVSHAGKFYAFEDVTLTPRPVQQPLPIWVGSWAAVPRAAQRIARHAVGWQPSGLHTSAAQIREGWAAIERACEQIGRDPGTVRRAYVNVVARIGSTREQALANVALPLRTHEDLPIAGPAEEVVAGFHQLAEAGIEDIVVILEITAFDQLELIAAEVLPNV